MSATVALWIIAAYYATRLVQVLAAVAGEVLAAWGERSRIRKPRKRARSRPVQPGRPRGHWERPRGHWEKP
jgi:hypothetical protein